MKFLILLSIFFSAKSALAQSPIIATSINPVYQIVLAITQNKNNTILIMNSNASDHDWQFKKSDLETLNKAKIVFYIDDGFEKPFAKISKKTNSYQLSKTPQIKILQSRGDIKKKDFHLWLNPENAEKMAEFVAQKICEIDEKNCLIYKENLAVFKNEISKSVQEIKNKLRVADKQNYVFYHDAYQYFEDYFSLKPLSSISKNHESYLTVRNLREFDEIATSKKIKCLFGDVVDEKNSAQKLAENYQIKFAKLDPIGGDNVGYFRVLMNVADEMWGCLK
jgi:zinc transport system substrate-binding protein